MKNLVIYSIQEIWHCLDSLKIFGVRLDSFGYTYVNSYKDILACVYTAQIQFCNKKSTFSATKKIIKFSWKVEGFIKA